MDPKCIIAAVSLDTVDGTGRTLATEASAGGSGGGGAALGSGAFGKVGTYRYHGATVAVKELKAGVDAESIGALFVRGILPTHPHPTFPLDAAAAPLVVCFIFRCCVVLHGPLH